LHGTVDAVAGIGNLTLFYDPVRIDAATARAHLADAWERTPAGEVDARAVPLEIPVHYGGSDGPDLDAVAAACGMDAETCIAYHTAGDYTVYAMGFAPGFAYIGGLNVALQTVRRAQPRPRVAAGSVAIAGLLTGIYPLASPGGWNVIGRTDLVLFDPARTPPSLLALGAPVRFVRA
jgi:5-oxoprolinase (ATP-hydrolysing) subunit B